MRRTIFNLRLPPGAAPFARSAVAILVAGSAASCSNPLGPVDSDYAKGLAPERLRSIDRFDSARYAAPAPAPTPAASDAPTVFTPPPSRLDLSKPLEVSIEDARVSALANNLDLKVALIDPAVAGQRLREERAKFEAVFTQNLAYAENDAPTLNTTQSNSQDNFRGGLGVSIPMTTGGRASVNFTENFSQTNNPFVTLNSSYSPSLDLVLSQPLLRNAGRKVNTASIRIAALNQQLSEAATRLEVIRQVTAVDRAYWVLDALQKELLVRLDELKLSQEQLDRARRLVNAGSSGEIEVIRAESAAASKLDGIITAENAVIQQQRELKRLMNRPDAPIESTGAVLCQTAPEPQLYAFQRAELTALALQNRSEMLQLELQLASDYTNIEVAKNQALPSFVLDYRYSIDGLGRSLASSNRSLYDNNFESWSIGLSGEIPLGNEAAKSRIQQAVLGRIQRLATREARSQAIVQEVLGALDNVEANWQRILASRQSLATAEREYAAEDRALQVGNRTFIDVLDATTRLANARSNLIRAVANYQISQVDLAFATGTVLGAGAIDWSPVNGDQPFEDPTPNAFQPPLGPLMDHAPQGQRDDGLQGVRD